MSNRYDLATRMRFFAKTHRNPANGCLERTGARKKPSKSRPDGGRELPYGMFWLEGRKVAAHRVAKAFEYNVAVAALPLVGHECDNPLCVDGAHLICSSPSQNLQEAHARGRRNLSALLAWWDNNPITIDAAVPE